MDFTQVSSIQYAGTICFILAILHTFSVKFFQKQALRFSEGSVGENFFHFLGEVEVVFGIWAAIFILSYSLLENSTAAISYLEARRFTEPLLVFVLMAVCASKPILYCSTVIIDSVARILPLNKNLAFYISALVVGPILGSFITEPAAMTVTALILLQRLYNQGISLNLKYATIGLLFVNVSIGGTLTSFAAPPVLMVAAKWNWDMVHMLTHFGWKAFIAIVVSTVFVAMKFKREISNLKDSQKLDSESSRKLPFWVIALHLLFLFLIVLNHHHSVVFMAFFLFFLGLTAVTEEYQASLNLKGPLLVSFFLGGLVVLGGVQGWWLKPILSQMGALSLYLGAAVLTAFTDNAAITYLGSQVVGLSEISKYALVAGSVVGGGLTVIANAPNPAGYSILNSSFGTSGISAWNLFKSALVPTLVAAVAFWVL